jgi:C-terminal processing protease CtpA/Prc
MRALCSQINVGDIIFAVNGETVTGMPVHEVVYKIKGEPGTDVSPPSSGTL